MFSVFGLLLDLILVCRRLLQPRGRRSIVAEHLLLRQQLIAIGRKRKRAPDLTRLDRVVFAVSSLLIHPKRLRRLSISVAHSTLLKLHQALVKRKYSKLFLNHRAKTPGPKGPSLELIRLIIEIKRNNPGYGCPKIALLVSKLLGDTINEHLVRRILRKGYFVPPTSGGGPSWLNQIGKVKDALWSTDLFCCESITLQTHWVMVVMDYFTREMIGIAVTQGSSCGEDICRIFSEISSASSRLPFYLSTDHDPLFRYHPWQANLRVLGIDEIKSVPEVPWSHPFIERLIGSVRREYLDETLFWNARDLKIKLNQFKGYYNVARVHSSLLGKTPLEMGDSAQESRINIKNYSWKSYCNGRFSIPVAA